MILSTTSYKSSKCCNIWQRNISAITGGSEISTRPKGKEKKGRLADNNAALVPEGGADADGAKQRPLLRYILPVIERLYFVFLL